MPRSSRLPRAALVYLLAIPVVLGLYLSLAGRRAWRLARPPVAALFGATVIGTIYADLALRRTPATPMRAAVAMSLAVALVAPGISTTATAQASEPATAVIQAARAYLGTPYKLGTEGPNLIDCSGLIYRAFKDAGQVQRIGSARRRAVSYMRWFIARGQATRNIAEAEPGDLVVWNDGSHAGIYLGDNKAISALRNPWGVTIHALDAIDLPFTYVLKVDWRDRGSDGDGRRPDNEPDGAGTNPPAGPATDGDRPRDRPRPPSTVVGAGNRAVTTGSLTIRAAPAPDARIVGWISRGREFTIVDTGRSPSGALWYEIESLNGKRGWIWSYWTRTL